MNTQLDNKIKQTTDGLEIYAKKIVNDGVISSDTYTKIVTNDYYQEKGTVAVESSPTGKQGGIKGIFFEIGGNMQQDGVIKTDKNTVVGVNVRGDYTSTKGKIIQGAQTLGDWHTTWWGILALTFIAGIAIAAVIYFFGWNK